MGRQSAARLTDSRIAYPTQCTELGYQSSTERTAACMLAAVARHLGLDGWRMVPLAKLEHAAD